jgi:hypothetical protein
MSDVKTIELRQHYHVEVHVSPAGPALDGTRFGEVFYNGGDTAVPIGKTASRATEREVVEDAHLVVAAHTAESE